ncbi:UDP-N-acetylmuramate dehydrogenase [Bartonella sp. DGB1]|uniref:UDP-N-acetylmuramate dehydrogenase n=1 Tax=Bartonella sp. DGB1 TaxID=3239807 RepID=UPI003523A17D
MIDGVKLFNDLKDKFIDIEGNFTPNFELGKASWFRTGGQVEILFEPASLEDLIKFIKLLPKDIPIKLIGMGSNVLVRDGGLQGFVIRLSPRIFGDIKLLSPNLVSVGAGAPDKWLSNFALKNALGNFHFYQGIPGLIGGALRMNAGANGLETSQLLQEVTILDLQGKLHKINVSEMGYSYRHCSLPKDIIFIDATFIAEKEDPQKIQQDIENVQSHRNKMQPVKEKTGGSTFKNPAGYSAWKLIEEVGGRGFKYGGAQMSPLHCNFMVNFNEASAYDLETLGELMRNKVLEQKQIELEWEIDIIGQLKKINN